VRIELFGSNVDSIRAFDPANQTSVQRLDSVVLSPASEWILADPSRRSLKRPTRGHPDESVPSPAPATLVHSIASPRNDVTERIIRPSRSPPQPVGALSARQRVAAIRGPARGRTGEVRL
jgi:transcription-repair coupling factor (superfamily II helicase)